MKKENIFLQSQDVFEVLVNEFIKANQEAYDKKMDAARVATRFEFIREHENQIMDAYIKKCGETEIYLRAYIRSQIHP